MEEGVACFAVMAGRLRFFFDLEIETCPRNNQRFSGNSYKHGCLVAGSAYLWPDGFVFCANVVTHDDCFVRTTFSRISSQSVAPDERLGNQHCLDSMMAFLCRRWSQKSAADAFEGLDRRGSFGRTPHPAGHCRSRCPVTARHGRGGCVLCSHGGAAEVLLRLRNRDLSSQ